MKLEKECWDRTIDELKGMCREKGVKGFSEKTLMKQPWKEFDEKLKAGIPVSGPRYKEELVKLCCLETREISVTKETPAPKPIVDPTDERKLRRNRELLEEFLSNDEWKEMVENDLLMERDKGVFGYRMFCKYKDEPMKIRRYEESDNRGRVARDWIECPRWEDGGVIYYAEEEGNELADETMIPGFFSLFMMRTKRGFGCHAFDKENPKMFCLADGTPSITSKKRVHQKLRRMYFSPDRTREQYEDAFKPIYEVVKTSL